VSGQGHGSTIGSQKAARVFLSYAGSERSSARWLRSELQRRGIAVIMDDLFEPGSSIVANIGEAIQQAVLVLALVSADYLDRQFTEIELSAVMANPEGNLFPVVIGDPPRPVTERGTHLWTVLRGRTYFSLARTRESLDRLATMLEQLMDQRAGLPPRGSAPAEKPVEVSLLYDWEDGHLVERVEAALHTLGIAVSPRWFHSPNESGDESNARALGVLWTDAAASSTQLADDIVTAVARQQSIFYLVLEDSPAAPAASRVLRLPAARAGAPHDRARRSPRRSDRQALSARMNEALASNQGIPFHILGDRFCADLPTAVLVQDAYESAVYDHPAGDDLRLQAVLAYAAVRRFRGDWQTASHVLASEPVPATASKHSTSTGVIRLQAERLSLDFELGSVNGASDGVGRLLREALTAGDWISTIVLHRQLGMIEEERGRYLVARDHLVGANHYADDLLHTRYLTETVQVPDAGILLLADCQRQLATLDWRTEDLHMALGRLRDAKQTVASAASSPAADYLSNVIRYQIARVQYAIDNDYEGARASLQASYRALQRYDNPIRLATVVEGLARLELDVVRGGEAAIESIRPVLQKILRVRRLRGQDFTIARTLAAMGDLEFALGSWNAAADFYQDARDEFNRLGKGPTAAMAARRLAQCYSRMGDREVALDILDTAMYALDAPEQSELRARMRADVAALRPRRRQVDESDESTEMTAVGEYGFHQWLAREMHGAQKGAADCIVLGTGDDAAVIDLGGREQLVVSSDSVPPDMLETSRLSAAAYAARFAVVSSLSDVVAMGGEPVGLLLNLHVRRSTPARWTQKLLVQASDEAQRYGAAVIGGDLKERDHIALTTVAVGRVTRDGALTRTSARPGDAVVLTVSSARGMRLTGLGARWAHELLPLLSRTDRAMAASLDRDDAKYACLGLPIGVMRRIIRQGLATAAIDTSDGVLACARLMGEASGVGFEFFADRLDSLIDDRARVVANSLDITPLLFAFSAGHDWEMLLTVPAASTDRIAEIVERDPVTGCPNLAIVGRVVDRTEWSDHGITLTRDDGSPCVIPFFTDEKFVASPYQVRAHDWVEFAREATRELRG
jgi:thiamine-monophosphate kinase